MGDSTAHTVAMGDRGRFVVPAAVRERHGWHSGQDLVAIDTDAGLLVMAPEEALDWLRSRLEGRDLVAELLQDRRAEVQHEST